VPQLSPSSSFRGAQRANPESITTDACCDWRCGPGFVQHWHSWLWIPGSTLARRPGMTMFAIFTVLFPGRYPARH